MDANATPVSAPLPRVAPAPRVEAVPAPVQPAKAAKAPESEVAAKIEAQTKAELRPDLSAAKLLVAIDEGSGRFVNTLLDPNSQEVLRQYPSDAQLAFSRAVKAYLEAMSG